MNLDCEQSSLVYYDGDVRKVHRRYCGLKQFVLPRSSANVAIVESWKDTPYDLANYLRIHYRTEPANSPSNSKYIYLYVFICL